MSDYDTLRVRVEQAQAIANAATPGPWVISKESCGGLCKPSGRPLVLYAASAASGWPKIAAKGDDLRLAAAAPDLAALVIDLWAEVERLTAERDSLRSQAGEASHVLAAALYGDERAGEQPHLSSLARMMVDALTLEAANAEQARMQLDNGDDVDAATRRYLGEALGIADSDDTPPSLSDFYDAVVEARAERDAAAAKERAAVVAWLRRGSWWRELDAAAAAIEDGDHLEASRA